MTGQRDFSYIRSTSADMYLQHNSRQQLLEEELKRQEFKFTRIISTLERQIEKQFIQIEELKLENKKSDCCWTVSFNLI